MGVGEAVGSFADWFTGLVAVMALIFAARGAYAAMEALEDGSHIDVTPRYAGTGPASATSGRDLVSPAGYRLKRLHMLWLEEQ
jgi:hypothetical protein